MNVQVCAVPVREQKMEYVRFGRGKTPLVIVAGMSLTGIMDQAEAIAAAYACFAEDYTVYVFERLPVLPEGCTVRDMAEDLACALDRLGISGADMMGSSQGGMIVQCLAALHPELVRAAVLASTTCRPNPTSDETFRIWRDTARTGDPAAVNDAAFRRIYTEKFREENVEVFAALAKTGTPEQCVRFAVLAEACRSFDSTDMLDKIRCPVLVIGVWGDMVLSGKASLELAERLHCEVYMYEGFGHSVCDEAPDFKQRMLDFFRRAAASDSETV